MTKLLAVGDLHLGAGSDYGREPGDRLADQEKAWGRALELAAEHDVDAVLFAGDAFHRRRPTPAELIAFQRPLMRFLAENNTDFLAIVGNHDCEAADLPTALDVFDPIIDVHRRPGLWQTRGCTVATLPWSPVSRLVAARDGGDRDGLNQEAAGLLTSTARGLRAQIPTGQPAVLLLHWSISGASTPTGVLTDDFREVVLDVDELERLGFDAVVAGHIHKPQFVDGDSGRIFYVGSPAPVDFGEASVDHGCSLVELNGTSFFGFLPIQSRPFVTYDFDLTGAVDDEAPWPSGTHLHTSSDYGDVGGAVVRVRYRATEEQARRIDQAELRRRLYDAGAHRVYAIQADIVRENRARVDGVDEELEPLQAVAAWASANDLDTKELGDLAELTASYLEEVHA